MNNTCLKCININIYETCLLLAIANVEWHMDIFLHWSWEVSALAFIVGYFFAKHDPFVVHLIMDRDNKGQTVNRVLGVSW